jgi:hypothetical protein
LYVQFPLDACLDLCAIRGCFGMMPFDHDHYRIIDSVLEWDEDGGYFRPFWVKPRRAA